jgi:hypothetical protein
VKKGPWSPEEDAKLKAYIEEHGTGGNWIALPQKIGMYVRLVGRSLGVFNLVAHFIPLSLWLLLIRVLLPISMDWSCHAWCNMNMDAVADS